jgi:hypothetical protein
VSVHWHTILTVLFGPGTWGAGGNMVAWVLCGVISFGWLHSREKARHLQLLAQAGRHHQELLAQARDHHQAEMERMDAHLTTVKAHVEAMLTAHHARMLTIIGGGEGAAGERVTRARRPAKPGGM